MKRLVLVLVMVMMIIPGTFAQNDEEVIVTLPNFDVTLNGQVIDNVTEQYPFIQYKGITYIPMTWDLSSALGLKTKWSKEDGLSIMKADSASYYMQKGEAVNVIGKSYSAKLVDFPVQVNGKTIDNSKETYPILNFKNITYFPMTYYFMVTEFNSGYKWDDKTGLSVAVDESLEIVYPKAETYEFKMTLEEFQKENLFIRERCKLRHETEYSNGFYYVNYSLEEYKHSVLDVMVDYYDKNGKYWYTEPILTGVEYKLAKEYEPPYGNGHAFMFPEGATAFKIRMTFTPKVTLVNELEKELKERNVNIKIVDSSEVTYELIKSLGVYFETRMERLMDFRLDPDDDLLRYAALNTEHRHFVNDVPKYKISYTFNGVKKVDIDDPKDYYSKVSNFSKFVFDTEKDYLNFEMYLAGVKESERNADFIYIYDKDKELTTILAVKNMILRHQAGVE